LLGRTEPSGRLPVHYQPGPGAARLQSADLTQDPLFAFGEGLSCTAVHDSDPTIQKSVVTSTGTLRATVPLTRTGRRPARETAQAYARDRVTSVTWTDRE
jgi:beta-glucosidase